MATLPSELPDVALANTLDGAASSSRPPGGIPDLSAVTVPGAIPEFLKSWDHYEILRPLGQGGMGTVFWARDRRLGRMVALKFLRLPSPDAARRMQQEARAQARLDHDGICKIFEVGEFCNQPYIAMEHLDGQPLHEALGRLTLEQKVLLLSQIALAVHAAHSQGILHRDLKPANIMLCGTSAEATDGSPRGLRPVLLDFGLARDSRDPQQLTQTGVVMGTPHYMAPEQARGQSRHLDRRADVYSLGAILYEMLAGTPPFDAESEVDLLLAVLDKDPQPLRQREPSIPNDLEVIALKCLRKEPAQRYESALALAQDLQRYLRSEPILARPASALYRLRRLAVRQRALVAVGVVLLCSLCGMAAFALHAKKRGEEQRRMAAELGQENARMNFFLRIAYSLPVHDLREDRRDIELNLSHLQARVKGTDPSFHGTLESAIGEGYLALLDYEEAAQHLRTAVKLGERSASVKLALGMALGYDYLRKVADVRRGVDGEQAKRRIVQLRQTLLIPAQQALREGQNTEQIPSEYVQALLHFFNENLNEALRSLHKAREDSSWKWRIEPLALEGKIVTEQYRNAVNTGNPSAKSTAQRLHDLITRGIEIARSYPDFYHSDTEYAIISIRNAYLKDLDLNDFEPLFQEAVKYANVAIALQPDKGEALDQLADLYAVWAYALAWKKRDPEPTLKLGLQAIEQALRLGNERARTYLARGRLYHARRMYQENLNQDSFQSIQSALQDVRKALALEPENEIAQTLLVISLSSLVELKRWQGRPHEQEDHELFAAVQRDIDLHPELPLKQHNLALLFLDQAKECLEHSLDCRADLESAGKVIKELRTRHPAWDLGLHDVILLEQHTTHDELNKGQDVSGRVRQLIDSTQKLRQKLPRLHVLDTPLGEGYEMLADALLSQGQSPVAAIDEGVAVIAGLDAGLLGDGQVLLWRTHLLLQKARWLMQNGQSPEPMVQMVLSETEHVDQLTGTSTASLIAGRAQALRLRGEWLQRQHQTQPALSAVEAGLALCDKARRTERVDLFYIAAEEGALLAVKAQLLRNPQGRAAVAGQAIRTLRSLLLDRKPLARELHPYLEAAERLTGQPESR
jgi:serine/threonine-protein kinase